MSIVYRKEIDGLRSLCILSVIIYHLGIADQNYQILKAGFIGVDIFFVISGYLINGIIHTQMNNNNFSLLLFYEKRARRIIPTLLIATLLLFPFAYIYLIPSSLIDFSKSSFFSSIFISNIYFYKNELSYFSLESFLKPLLHTWSLSVEMQFYFIFPIILLFINKIFKTKYLNILIIIFIINLVFSNIIAFIHPSFAFYNLSTRIWEFLLGAISFNIRENIFNKINKNYYINLLPKIGISIIFIFMSFLNVSSNKSFIFLIFPTIGACFFLIFSQKEELLTKIISSKIFVKIGVISYSLYIRHYPIIIFQYYKSNFEGFNLFNTLILIFLTSIISFYCIEKNFRNIKIISTKLFIQLLLLLLVLVNTFAYLASTEMKQKKYFLYNIDNKLLIEEKTSKLKDNYTFSFISNNRKKMLIVGDSHGEDFFYLLKINPKINSQYDIAFSNITSQDKNLLDFFLNLKKCNSIDKYQSTQINNESLDIDNKKLCSAEFIIISKRWFIVNKSTLDQILDLTKIYNKKLILTTNTPHYLSIGQFTLIDIFIYKNNRMPNDTEINLLKKKYYKFYDSVNWLKDSNLALKEFSNFNNIILLDKNILFCDENNKSCNFLTNNNQKIFFDSSHMTLDGIKFISNKIYESNWFLILEKANP